MRTFRIGQSVSWTDGLGHQQKGTVVNVLSAQYMVDTDLRMKDLTGAEVPVYLFVLKSEPTLQEVA